MNDYGVNHDMSLLFAKGRQWVRRHRYATLALLGVAVFAVGYPVIGYLLERNQEISRNLSVGDPNFVYYHDGGDALLAGLLICAIGGGLLLSPAFGLGYELVGPKLNRLKLKGSNVS